MNNPSGNHSLSTIIGKRMNAELKHVYPGVMTVATEKDYGKIKVSHIKFNDSYAHIEGEDKCQGDDEIDNDESSTKKPITIEEAMERIDQAGRDELLQYTRVQDQKSNQDNLRKEYAEFLEHFRRETRERNERNGKTKEASQEALIKSHLELVKKIIEQCRRSQKELNNGRHTFLRHPIIASHKIEVELLHLSWRIEKQKMEREEVCELQEEREKWWRKLEIDLELDEIFRLQEALVKATGVVKKENDRAFEVIEAIVFTTASLYSPFS
ncbi:hypothetical protein DM02DRAFT_628113 [Periconia macrospinosa]|uniref:Uncharacterized protein n=1 Tax=Periconia macrospinosa TaxID=97972 RepID=A0A2V1DUE4_9PLEO|nr:hypothetical protein DM02DRAFT_628113 [Periconia macrospinosa]